MHLRRTFSPTQLLIYIMILSNLSNCQRIEALSPALKRVLEYVRQHDLTQVSAGRITIEGTDIFINVDDAQLVPQEQQKLEVHRQYIDIHFPLNGNEVVGWSDIQQLTTQSVAPFDCDKDFAFYAEQPSTYFTVHPGEFYVMFPEDAHAPIIGHGNIRKLVAKIRVTAW